MMSKHAWRAAAPAVARGVHRSVPGMRRGSIDRFLRCFMLDPTTVAAAFTVLMLLLMAIGVPVAICMGAAGFAGLFLLGGTPLALGQLYTVSYNTVANYAFAVLPTFLFMGNEQSGLPSEYEAACDVLVKIPMVGKADSLNVAVAAGIVLFEAVRQRTAGRVPAPVATAAR